MELTEESSYEELLKGMREVIDYGLYHRSKPAHKAGRVLRNKKDYIVADRVNTPAPHRYRALYMYVTKGGGNYFLPILVVKGKDKINGKVVEVDSFVTANFYDEEGFDMHNQDPRLSDEYAFCLEIIHGHSVRRYMERNGNFEGTLEDAQLRVCQGLFGHSSIRDKTNGDVYIYFDGGVFRCHYAENKKMLHLHTFIMNRMCRPNQRMKSLESEQGQKEIYEKLGFNQ